MDWRAAAIALIALLYFLMLPVAAVLWELAVVLVCLPAIMALAIAAGHAAVLPGGALLGRLSYPLYGLHLPLIAMASGMLKYGGTVGGGHWSSMLLVLPLLAAAWAALTWFDEPLRARLAARWLPGIDSTRPAERSPFSRAERLLGHGPRTELVRN